MKIMGIIAEFNPFHNGHKYLINESIKKLNPDLVLCVMSGNFVQRGEPSIIDKWSRSKIALENGINLIFELPLLYASQNADVFSKASIKILDKLGIDYLSFGTENNNIDILMDMNTYSNTNIFKKNLSENLNLGYSYPKSYALALAKKFEANDTLKPNNILALEYLKKIENLKSDIIPFNIKRKGSDYKSEKLEGDYSSASAIRKVLLDNKIELIRNTLPSNSYKELKAYNKSYENYNHLDLYFNIIKYLVLSKKPKELRRIYDISEGLNNRIYNSIDKANNVKELIELISTKRYTHSKISRCLTNILLDIKSDYYDIDIDNLSYLKVLASDKKGLKFLGRNSSFSFITKYSEYKKMKKTNLDQIIFEKTLLSTDIYYSGLLKTNYMNLEYKKNPYIKI